VVITEVDTLNHRLNGSQQQLASTRRDKPPR
jgi:hypothetical protein